MRLRFWIVSKVASLVLCGVHENKIAQHHFCPGIRAKVEMNDKRRYINQIKTMTWKVTYRANSPETTALHDLFKVCGSTDWFWLNCFTLPNSYFSLKTPLSFSAHRKHLLYCLFIQIWNWNKHQLVRISSRWEFWGKLLSSFCQLSWKIKDCLRSMPGLPPCIRNTKATKGALAEISLRVVLLPNTVTKHLCDFCWTAPDRQGEHQRQ